MLDKRPNIWYNTLFFRLTEDANTRSPFHGEHRRCHDSCPVQQGWQHPLRTFGLGRRQKWQHRLAGKRDLHGPACRPHLHGQPQELLDGLPCRHRHRGPRDQVS